MTQDTVIRLLTAILFIGIMYWNLRKLEKLEAKVHKERQTYLRIYQDSSDLLGERYIRWTQRTHVLHVCDWAHARKYNTSLLGLPLLLPSNILEGEDKIDVGKYFTDEEYEAIAETVDTLSKDRRTKPLADHFIVKK